MARAATDTRLHGRFRVLEDDRRFDASLVAELLAAEWPPPAIAYVVRGAVDGAVCEAFAERFRATVAAEGTSRPGDGLVEVLQVGATQHARDVVSYLGWAARARASVEALFTGPGDEGREQILREHLLGAALAAHGLGFRPAGHHGAVAGPCAARSWTNRGAWHLEPHEDQAQLAVARAQGFEIGPARGPLATVVTVTDDHGGGELVLWDWAPDDAARDRLGLASTGYPYPHHAVAGYPSLEIATRRGDFVLLRSDFVHAIRPTHRPGRISVGRFLGRIGDEVVTWT